LKKNNTRLLESLFPVQQSSLISCKTAKTATNNKTNSQTCTISWLCVLL